MHTSPVVGVIVLNYNGQHCLLSCLQSLEQLRYTNKEIIVVDNHSSDDSLLIAEKKFPHCIFIRNNNNDGFAKGMNAGMREAIARGAEWCWLFNYDAISDPDALTQLMRVATTQPHKIGLVSPIIYTNNKQIWFAKGTVNFFRMRVLHISPAQKEWMCEAYPSEFLTGCALLVNKRLINTIGFLDERFFLYYEDADYSLRAREAGLLCLVVPEASVVHSEASSQNTEKVYFLVYSGLLFFQKWGSPLLQKYYRVYGTIRRIKNWLDRIVYNNSPSARAVYRAYQNFYGQ